MLPGEDSAARRVLLVCMAAGATTLLDQAVLNIAVPSMRQSIGATGADLQWIVAGYSLAFGLALVPGGSLGDLHGRKRLFMAGVAVFLAAGVTAATGGGPGTLIGARLVQGAAAGLVNSQVIGTVQDVFHGVGRARALGMYAVTGGVATALGPPLGGALVAGLGPEAGWRCCLLMSPPCAVLTLALAARWLPPPRRTAHDSRLDVLGLALLCGCTLTLMVPFIRTPDSGGEALQWGTAVCALAAVFAVHQRLRVRRGRPPLVHPALTSSKPYMLGTAVAMAQFGSSLAAFLVLTVFLQDGLGLSALFTAAVTLPGAVGMGVSSAFAWRLVRRIGPRTVTVGLTLGIGAALAGAVAALQVPTAVLPVALAGTQLMSGVAGGLTVSPNQAQVLQHAPPEAAGVGGGILQMAQRIAAAVCLSAVPAVYLHAASGPSGGSHPRAGYALASCVCAGLLAAALLLSLLRRAATPARPSALASTNHAGVVPRPRETT
ncbi:MFS transporter [Streptomyces cinerochromogenes]|uniref:MFS transporter n=1 Tax=Streptomyces cinerochromogenes TaxID=66422 RepID=UPI001670CA8E|nr:MFS transporter [Streptomyces cinerochromogenes]GGS62475.1 MFS transporter [Streptomyces cinerochromogenes]